MENGTRTERDSLGEMLIPKQFLWGAQTQRSLLNFPIGHERFSREMIWALGLVKKACAMANQELGLLDAHLAQAIMQAADEVQNGKLDEHFPLVIWQTGSATHTHMNANEVIANRAIQILGGQIGSKNPVHPNDHVNMGQSSNDVFPTVMHVAAASMLQHQLSPALEHLRQIWQEKAAAFAQVIKIGRTHLQDATPLTLGQEWSGYMHQLSYALHTLQQTKSGLFELALGGTAVGTGLNAHPQFGECAAKHISTLTNLPFISGPNKFALLSAHDALVQLSSACRQIATVLMKMANDIRWLASGPRCGIGELILPANEPGSSIMPGKVNPSQAEALTMVCCQVMGNDVTVSLAASGGYLQLNLFKPVLIYNILQSIQLLADATSSFSERCIQGLQPNVERIQTHVSQSLMLVTALNPLIGYDRAAKVAQHAFQHNLTLKQAAIELSFLSADEFDRAVKPENMLGSPYVPKR